MSIRTILLLASKELRDLRTNKWFALGFVAFGLLFLATALPMLSGATVYSMLGFERVAAGTINLVLLVVPLVGLLLGALSISSERERGTLLYLLTQPLTEVELLLGKFVGQAVALVLSLVFGFGLIGLVMLVSGAQAGGTSFVAVAFLAGLLGLASLAAGLFISSLSGRTSTAAAMAVLLWLALVLFCDLGLMGSSLVLDIGTGTLFTLTVLNPLQAFKVAAVLMLGQGVDILGPGGVYATRVLGSMLLPVLTAILIGWSLATLIASYVGLRWRGVR